MLVDLNAGTFITSWVFITPAGFWASAGAYFFSVGEQRGGRVLRVSNIAIITNPMVLAGYMILALYPTLPLALKLVARAALIFSKEATVLLFLRYTPKRSPSGQRKIDTALFILPFLAFLMMYSWILRFQQVSVTRQQPSSSSSLLSSLELSDTQVYEP